MKTENKKNGFKALPAPKTIAEYNAFYWECSHRAAIEKINKRPEHEAYWLNEAKQASDYIECLLRKGGRVDSRNVPGDPFSKF